MSPKLPKKISIHISTSYSSSSFARTYSLGAVVGILSAIGLFVAGVVVMLGFSLKTYIDWAEVEALRTKAARLDTALARLPELQEELAQGEKGLDRVRIMLGLKKAPDTLDITDVVLKYEPVIPELPDSTDTLESEDSTKEDDIDLFYPQVYPTVGFKITQKYSASHPGIDFATSEGKPCFATSDGVIIEVGYDSTLYGNYIKIRHGKYYETFYAHLKNVVVKKGDKVKMNQIVGFVGNTGMSSAPHLHFEVRHKGKAIDPSQMLVLGREYKGRSQ
ncbi:peptidoglycan DD-metalloendopeptidase family protein [candidate division WOR-3 bacterium]|uniref:Peptidoglycan DD-metalloendopeptidase family protein n=1 Tax=candidate division WOR-3 bacterium TaxID=2052148 RepID=A0A9D5QDA3_UNCW3|nr:peptidoglycan DD-metalloendopeptidase family protein [candidate division WOR-3 bacterium]MBD3364902.1 peptidoglycan DD-metalloendopeptidase family protein [candidate division WOR-3 bacterium]